MTSSRGQHASWRALTAKEAPEGKLRPTRDALCSVLFLKAREWLCGKGTQLKAELRRRVWLEARDSYLGQTILVDSKFGASSEREEEILALSAEHLDLLAYLVCSRHGKVRLACHASPADQDASDLVTRIRGVREGDLLPETPLATSVGAYVALPPTIFRHCFARLMRGRLALRLPTPFWRLILMPMDWKEAIKQWQALPPEEKARRRWERIPLKVAMSMAFEGEPVDLRHLEEVHARQPLPPDVSALPSVDSVTSNSRSIQRRRLLPLSRRSSEGCFRTLLFGKVSLCAS